MSSSLKLAMAFQVVMILLLAVDEMSRVSAQAQVPIIPGAGAGGSGAGSGSGSGSGTNSTGACNFRYMLTKYNGCQSYVLMGTGGTNVTDKCCKPMAKFAYECGPCSAMLRPFANSLLGICNLPSCN